MRSVVVWACRCGIRYKAICEINRETSPNVRCNVTCRTCQKVIQFEARLLELFQEIANDGWYRLVPFYNVATELDPAIFHLSSPALALPNATRRIDRR